jgi:hypothetical protein
VRATIWFIGVHGHAPWERADYSRRTRCGHHRLAKCKFILATSAITSLIGASAPARAQGNSDREAYFGETHIHTSYSLDAWTFGDRNGTPGDSYKYFKGEPIKSPAGYDVKIDTPLDFAGVTDHSNMSASSRWLTIPARRSARCPRRSR